MCGLEVANLKSVYREDQLKLLELKTISDGKHKTPADILKKLINVSEYSCTFDPGTLSYLTVLTIEVAAAVVVLKDVVVFEEVLLKVEVDKETKHEGKLIESKDGVKIYLGKSLERDKYFMFLQHIIQGDYV